MWTPRFSGKLESMRNPEYVPLICTLLAIEVAHLRWIIFTQWRCRRCASPHIDCGCKPNWIKRLL